MRDSNLAVFTAMLTSLGGTYTPPDTAYEKKVHTSGRRETRADIEQAARDREAAANPAAPEASDAVAEPSTEVAA